MPYLGVKPADEFTSKDLNGEELILDADADTTITADTDDQIDIRIAGADDFQFTANTMSVLSGSTLNIDSGATIANSGTATGFPSVGNNLIINPEFRVAQRGASFTLAGMTSHDYHLDRWKLAWETGLTARITITQDTSGVFAAWGSDTCMKIDCTTADASLGANDYCDISQRIEAQDLQHLEYGTAGARDITLSFLIKSPKSGTHSVLISQYDGSGRYFPANFTVTSADTAEKITIQIPGDTSGQIDNDTGVGLQVSFPLATGATRCSATAGSWTGSFAYPTTSPNLLDNTANDTYIGQVKLEVGGTATDFSQSNFESYGTTLNKCKRYYQIILAGSNVRSSPYTGDPAEWIYQVSGTAGEQMIRLQPEMRTVPTSQLTSAAHIGVEVGSIGSKSSTTCTSATFESGYVYTGQLWTRLEWSGSTGDRGDMARVYVQNSDCLWALSAEL